MKATRDVELTRCSTMRLKAVGAAVYEPMPPAELGQLLRDRRGTKCHFLDAGSNVVSAERAEGNYMEPDKTHGCGYLGALRGALGRAG